MRNATLFACIFSVKTNKVELSSPCVENQESRLVDVYVCATPTQVLLHRGKDLLTEKLFIFCRRFRNGCARVTSTHSFYHDIANIKISPSTILKKYEKIVDEFCNITKIEWSDYRRKWCSTVIIRVQFKRWWNNEKNWDTTLVTFQVCFGFILKDRSSQKNKFYWKTYFFGKEEITGKICVCMILFCYYCIFLLHRENFLT